MACSRLSAADEARNASTSAAVGSRPAMSSVARRKNVASSHTSDGGTHLSAFREGLLKAVNEYCGGKYEGDDVRECMVGAVAIRLKDPMFESQTKNKLGNTEIRTELVNSVREELLHFFQRNKQIAETIIAKVKDTQELRKELQNVKKLARERAKAITLRIPQLKDCKNHFDKKKEKGKGTMVFICEGQSAAGSITSCRDVNNQAVFVLKGKPLNVWDLKRDVMYKNDEMYNLMQSLNVGKAVIDHHRTQDDLGGLRFVDIQAEAAGRLAYEATKALGVPITPEAAQALFIALATDTGWFRHSSTAPRTFALAEELVAAGANPTAAYDALYEQSTLARFRLLGRALERMQAILGGRIVYTEVLQQDYEDTGAIPPDTEDLINFARGVTGVEIALVFIEQRDGTTKVSFRGKEPHDVSKLAEQFQGGGHKLAAGATVMKPLAEARATVLSAAQSILPV